MALLRIATTRRIFTLLLASGIGCLLLLQNRSPSRSASVVKDRPNILLLSIDTLRADRLGIYGYDRATSPFIDALGAAGTVFDEHVSASSWTLPAHASMLTGVYPTTHGATAPETGISTDVPLVSELLQRAGYRTIGLTGGHFVSPRFGFYRGFDFFLAKSGLLPDRPNTFAKTIDTFEKQLGEVPPGTPYFAFLHTYDVHCPYNPPEPYLSMFRSPSSEPLDPRTCYGRPFNYTPGQIRFLSDTYDGGIRWADAGVGRLIELLRKRSDFANTVVIVTSDHGEEFMEHGYLGHGRSLYRIEIRTPLIVTGPGVRPQRVARPVGQIDIAPTILDLAGERTPESMQGISLAPILRGSVGVSAFRRFQFSEVKNEYRNQISRLSESEHAIAALNTKRHLFFGLTSDPDEMDNLWPKQESIRAIAELLKFRNSLVTNPPLRVETPVPQEIRQLRALGYLGDSKGP